MGMESACRRTEYFDINGILKLYLVIFCSLADDSDAVFNVMTMPLAVTVQGNSYSKC
jgi:hypothetical protein